MLVGESREEIVDVRILFAAHKNLSELVAQGLFREDLFYRINIMELGVPALRERPEDMRNITNVILEILDRRAGLQPPNLGEDALELLKSLPFAATCAS